MSPSTYIFQANKALPILAECQQELQTTIDECCCCARPKKGSSSAAAAAAGPQAPASLIELQTTLDHTEQLIRDQMIQLLLEEEEEEEEGQQPSLDTATADRISRMTTLEISQTIQEQYDRRRRRHQQQLDDRYHHGHHNPQDDIHHTHHHHHEAFREDQRRRFASSLLFNLSVQLQILLVRIHDVNKVLNKGRPRNRRRLQDSEEDNSDVDENNTCTTTSGWSASLAFLGMGISAAVGLAAVAVGSIGLQNQRHGNRNSSTSKDLIQSLSEINYIRLVIETTREYQSILKGGVSMVLTVGISNSVRKWLMLRKIEDSNYNKIQRWNDQWINCHSSSSKHSSFTRRQHPSTVVDYHRRQQNQPREQEEVEHDGLAIYDGQQQQQVIEYTVTENRARKTFWWMSQGELRWSIIQRFMHVYYSSVGAAINTNHSSSPLSTLLMTGAASCFFSVTGGSKQTMAVLNDSKGATQMLKNAWGLPSLKQAKQASLFFNRFVKGASVSDKITIAGVPCFILSKHPVPELAELRNQPMTQRSQSVSQMSTIAEEEETESHDTDFEFSKTFGKRDVIVHLTGGGFFAHTIASDLPYLLDWSSMTNTVVIAPEYALLPETFPVALNQIIDIYQSLVNGSALPFEIDRICVTGESAGGNLAAALCVHLIQSNQNVQEDDSLNTQQGHTTATTSTMVNRLPDCMMLSCPALDLSTDCLGSPSRIRGREDPVLPNGLLAAIRDSYTGQHDKNDPLCSPLQASDQVLCDWCPLLMFVGSDDPLLDDAVAFNDRLQQCGVQSEIRAATNVPHAYLGLATAGFPEAVEQHEYAMRWLKDIFGKNKKNNTNTK
eukprot:CAMPEP_0113505388 /NCGR_PEP_ID=MMETSP0014_2-20120614/35284_1 /TAXON_ID=2857 /ORGANISM="Nitzschia sp." /LENGTH=835 /DNA_ID=CAMNT_0000400685 /DNA_START=66 /DNA_END=2573 /DNA_ORIENTATION=- /assembly_acc=CAM_ASM_000159